MTLTKKTTTRVIDHGDDEPAMRRLHLDTSEVVLLLAEAISGAPHPPFNAQIPDAEAAVRMLYMAEPDQTMTLIKCANAAIRYFVASVESASLVCGVGDMTSSENIQ